MALREHSLDLKDRVEQIDDRLEDIEDEKERLEDVAQGKMDQQDLDEPPADLEEKWGDLDDEETQLRGERWKFIETVVVWSGENSVTNQNLDDKSEDEVLDLFGDVNESVIRVKELTFGQLQRVSDDMMEESFDVDVEQESIEGTPRQGFYQTELLHEAITEWPTNAPVFKDEYQNEHPQPADYPIPVGEWLFDKVDALNTTGDTEMGNSSLGEALKSKR